MANFTENYDPGFLNVQGFGQSALNPKPPVFYQSLGIVQNLSVYESIYGTQTINAGEAFVLGESYFKGNGFEVQPPGEFKDSIQFDQNITVGAITTTQRLIVDGIEFKPTVISTLYGAHMVLAAY